MRERRRPRRDRPHGLAAHPVDEVALLFGLVLTFVGGGALARGVGLLPGTGWAVLAVTVGAAWAVVVMVREFLDRRTDSVSAVTGSPDPDVSP